MTINKNKIREFYQIINKYEKEEKSLKLWYSKIVNNYKLNTTYYKVFNYDNIVKMYNKKLNNIKNNKKKELDNFYERNN